MSQLRSVLVCNCGSSSVKFAMLRPETGDELLSGLAERLGSAEASIFWRVDDHQHTRSFALADHQEALRAVLDILQANPNLQPSAIGHRIVHGGEHFTAPALIDDDMLQQVRGCSNLAPLHNPANILGIEAAQKAFPAIPQVGVFDTAFHMSMPAKAYRYAISSSWYKDHGVRRYGFHGTSHRYVAETAARQLGKPLSELNLITAHLGNGCSAAAIQGGKSVDTTMGLTPLEGLVMGTRSGDIDPSIIAFMCKQLDWTVDEVTTALNKESGLLGLSGGLASDMRQLIAASADGNAEATLAIEVFCYRLAQKIAGFYVSLGGCDALIFTGGIGEHAVVIRHRVLKQLTALGFAVDTQRNEAHGRENAGQIAPPDSIPALVIPTNEELQIARETLDVLNSNMAGR